MFGVRAELSALWSEVANTKIENQVATSATASVQDAASMVEMAGKGGVNEQKRFVGTVGRNKLTASLILAVTDKLEGR